MSADMTLEARRDRIRELLATQRQTHARDKVAEAIQVGCLRADYAAEGRPAREFVAWVCGDAYQHVSRPALYDRLAADTAIAAGITTAVDGSAPVYSHLVAAGRRLQRGVPAAEVQAEVAAGNVSIRASKPDQAGLTAAYLPDTHLGQLSIARELTQMVFRDAGQPLPDNAPEVMAGMVDLLLECGYDVLLIAAHRIAGTAQAHVAERLGTRMVELRIQDADGEDVEPLTLAYGTEYVAAMDSARPTWDAAETFEDGVSGGLIYRVYA